MEPEDDGVKASLSLDLGPSTARRRGSTGTLHIGLLAALLVVAIVMLVSAVRLRSAAPPPPPPADAPAVCQCGCDPVVCPAPDARGAPEMPPRRGVANPPVDRAYLQQPARVRGSPYTTRIDAGVLIPGRGEPMADATVVFDDTNTILFVGPTAEVALEADVTYEIPVVMPVRARGRPSTRSPPGPPC